MKRALCIAMSAFILLSALLFAGCGEGGGEGAEDIVRVVVIDNGEPFTPEQSVYTVPRGEDLTLRLYADRGYAFDRCDYASYSVKEEEGACLLTLLGVRYPARVDIRMKSVPLWGGADEEIPDDGFRGVRYYVNGGTLGGSDAAWFEEPFTGEFHLRANTDTGVGKVEREGHTLLGWNTRPDGSGEHIGLGSRVTVPEGERAVLYAEWAPWTDASLFAYETEEEGAVLTSYLGEKEVPSLVIPARIGGEEVVRIGQDFADSLHAETLVLPPTLKAVEENAFTLPQIGEIYLFDSISEISDGSFAVPRGGERIKTVHVNAVRKPSFTTTTNNSYFAEVMDRLILNAEKKKMIFFAGCSFSYGLDSEMVEQAFGNEYVVCNMGVVGGTNATFQLDCMLPYLREGDVFVHAPEEMNPYQLLYDTSANTRMFMMVEGNYDLLALADLSKVSGFWDALRESNALRETLPPGEYTDFNPYYDPSGDINLPRPDSPPGSAFDGGALFKPEYIRDGTVSISRLNEYYGRMSEKGASVFFSYAPANGSAFTEQELQDRSWERFDAFIRDGLDPRFPVISDVRDYIFDGMYFFDTDYHLTERGAQLRTQRLIDDIRTQLEREQ